MTFYKDHFGKWHTEEEFFRMAKIFQSCFYDYLDEDLENKRYESIILLCCDEVKRFDSPLSVKDYLNMGMKVEAVRMYQTLHGGTLVEAKIMVDLIEREQK